jgi:minor extracellular serine protease Vpr
MRELKAVRALAILLLLTTLSIAFVLIPAASFDPNSDSVDSTGSYSTQYVIIQLHDPPLATYQGGIPGLAPTEATPGQRLDVNSPASQAYLNYLNGQHTQFKGWLQNNNPHVQVVREFSILFNGIAIKLNDAHIADVARGPGADAVTPEVIYHPDMDVSPFLIGLTSGIVPTGVDMGLWAALGGHANAGAGMKIGIIDTGIDQTHPFLTDASLTPPAGFPKCDALDSSTGTPDQNCFNVSNKVIVARVFQTATTFTATAVQAHGTHVSGIAAGVYGTSAPNIDGHQLSGVAPKAFLGNYNVFPDSVTSATSHDIMDAVQAAFLDGMDVVNLSLGGTARPHDDLVSALNNAAAAGMIAAVAAGNSGPGAGTIDSPGIAQGVITAGATTNPHFVGISVSTVALGTFGGALGQFANFVPPITATYTTTSPANSCTAISTNLTGDIALIARGGCTFSTKIRNAQTAGAVGVLVYNNQPGDPVAMAQDGTPSQPTIPAVMISQSKGLAMGATGTVTVDGTTRTEFFTDGPSADLIAGFSSRGPTVFPTLNLKPDVTAPGVNVYSSIPGGFAFFQGTSMATPHVAGAAALIKQLHPDWSPEQVKSALISSAKRPSTLVNRSVLAIGGGRIDLNAVVSVSATFDPASLTFGSIPTDTGFTRTITVTMISVSTSTFTYTLSTAPVQFISANSRDGTTSQITLTMSTTSITLNPGDTTSFTLTLQSVQDTTVHFYQSEIDLTGGAITLHIPIFIEVSTPGTPSTP